MRWTLSEGDALQGGPRPWSDSAVPLYLAFPLRLSDQQEQHPLVTWLEMQIFKFSVPGRTD